MWWASKSKDSECVCVRFCVHQEAFCLQQMLKPWEAGRRGAVYVCVCVVCCDSLQRKLDMCWITRDLEDGWLVEVGAMTSSTQTHGHQIYQILNIQRQWGSAWCQHSIVHEGHLRGQTCVFKWPSRRELYLCLHSQSTTGRFESRKSFCKHIIYILERNSYHKQFEETNF